MGECTFWYRPTRVVPDQRPLNGRCCCILRLAISTYVYFAKNVAYFPFNSWHSFQRLCHLLWGCHLGEKLLSRHKTHKCTHTQLTNCSMWPLERSVKNMLLSKSQMAQSTKQNNADLKTLCADITGWVPDSVSGIRFQSNVRPLRLLKTSSTIVHNKRAE